jgi:hypothetical protein
VAEPPLFHRIVVGLHPGTIDREAVEFAAELARLLGLALQGVFFENGVVSAIGGLASREFQLVRGEWRPADVERISEDVRLAARSAKRLLDDAARALGILSFFDVLSDESGSAITKVVQPSDMLVITTPKSPHERLASLDPKLVFPVNHFTTAMLLPRCIQRRNGPVVALVKTPQDRSLKIAATIARAANETLLLVTPRHGPSLEAIMAAATNTGAKLSDVELRNVPFVETHTLLSTLEFVRERFIVLPHAKEGVPERIDVSLIAAMRSAPVILAGQVEAA